MDSVLTIKPSQPEIEDITKELNNDGVKSLIIGSLYVPFDELQILNPLQQYTKSEIKSHWHSILHAPPEVVFKPEDIDIKVKFDLEEDYLLLTYIRLKDTISLDDFIQKFISNFKQIHSRESIIQRIQELELLDETQKQNIITRFTNQTIDEFQFHTYMTHTNSSPVNYPTRHGIMENHDVLDESISYLQHNLQFYAFPNNDDSTLALLRSETYEYTMHRRTILIGRGSHCDVNLLLECPSNSLHISRNQAILSFMQDYNFYLENIGTVPFRVNGALILPTATCRLPSGAILDFSDTLLMFIPNLRFIESMSEMSKKKKNKPINNT
ncbi:microspherule protein 1 [Histomonas meleagridis]|uniref:microspherule protein 1 n=1 Tax=Histomonas meleagridis TaxID=135588 RepID=UPI003559E11B|nr:microspherule protein 1 [Histomonas meleagridis]KAH0803334.1 microspherule protein 1 [Histomonas meleagridis]